MLIYNIIINIFIFLFGLCIGSFLNCVIYRIENEKSFISGRSFCPNCKHDLSWKDLIPVFSYLFLRARCRYCKQKISWQYPVVEIATGMLFILIFNYQFSIFNQFSFFQFFNLLFWFYVSSSLIVIFVYDLKHYLIPDNILFPAIVAAFIYKLFLGLSLSNWNLILNFLLAAIIASGFFFMIWAVSRGNWMGFGDVKLAILLGLILGFPNILVALFLSFFIGSIVGIILMAKKAKNFKSEIPFGPFLIFGTFVAMFFGSKIINWYTSLII